MSRRLNASMPGSAGCLRLRYPFELSRKDRSMHANPATFRQAASRFATGVAVLTACDENGEVAA